MKSIVKSTRKKLIKAIHDRNKKAISFYRDYLDVIVPKKDTDALELKFDTALSHLADLQEDIENLTQYT